MRRWYQEPYVVESLNNNIYLIDLIYRFYLPASEDPYLFNNMTTFGAPGFDFSAINATKFAEIWSTFDTDSKLCKDISVWASFEVLTWIDYFY